MLNTRKKSTCFYIRDIRLYLLHSVTKNITLKLLQVVHNKEGNRSSILHFYMDEYRALKRISLLKVTWMLQFHLSEKFCSRDIYLLNDKHII